MKGDLKYGLVLAGVMTAAAGVRFFPSLMRALPDSVKEAVTTAPETAQIEPKTDEIASESVEKSPEMEPFPTEIAPKPLEVAPQQAVEQPFDELPIDPLPEMQPQSEDVLTDVVPDSYDSVKTAPIEPPSDLLTSSDPAPMANSPEATDPNSLDDAALAPLPEIGALLGAVAANDADDEESDEREEPEFELAASPMALEEKSLPDMPPMPETEETDDEQADPMPMDFAFEEPEPVVAPEPTAEDLLKQEKAVAVNEPSETSSEEADPSPFALPVAESSPKPPKETPRPARRAPEETQLAARSSSGSDIQVRSYMVPAATPEPKPVHPYFQRFLDRGEYYVRPGDNLGNIAERLYGQKQYAQKILEVNRDLIGNQGSLQPGMTIRLP
ncbi:LysM domain/BON superfamily protein [Planctomycetes bacterium Pan216]|uniref:LysM domain/BON superfamily protein n=1 Tax=Kolteria novifilia TaxID=2527975 RepID=A0A518BB88_9BACT|nr:LysM domain/BON superfamily protein [Planctomycetes bacterium Pan216]